MQELKEWLIAGLIVIIIIAVISYWIDCADQKRHFDKIEREHKISLAKEEEKNKEIIDREKYFDKLLFNR